LATYRARDLVAAGSSAIFSSFAIFRLEGPAGKKSPYTASGADEKLIS
jgi:hypothetical protein